MSNEAAGDDAMGGWRDRLLRQLSYFLSSAPWTLVSSLAAGFVTYIIMVIFSQTYGLAAVGEFRLIISIVAMMSLTTLLDSGKLLVKLLVQDQQGIVRPLLINRMRWSSLGVIGGLITAAIFYRQGNALAPAIAAIALFLPILHPTNLYVQINQARRKFRLNAFINISQYGFIAAMAAVWAMFECDIIIFFVLFFLTTALCNSWFMSQAPECYEQSASNGDKISRDARNLSGSGLLQVVLEHTDKFLISYFLGLEALGLYAIGVSTGRLLLHFVKPLLIIYLPDLVEKRFSLNMQLLSFSVLTIVGVLLAGIMPFYMTWLFGTASLDAYPVAAVIVAGMGLHFVGTTKYYSSVYYKGASLTVPVLTNLITVPPIVAYLLLVLIFGGENALLLCALSYPLRELSNIVIISYLSATLHTKSSINSKLLPTASTA